MTLQVSVVIPVYKSEDCLDELARRLTHVLDESGRTYEVVLVNDCSPDKSWRKIEELCRIYPALTGINLRRNFGQDCALMAGLNHSSGELVVIMDDDLQHDPADISTLLAALEEGHDVCYARFDTKKQSLFKNFGSWVNDKAANIILRKPKEIYLSAFKALRREVADEIVRYDGPYPYVDGLIFRVTQNITQVTVEHHERRIGSGNYNLVRSLMVWTRLATNFSVLPLRIAMLLGFIASGIGFLLAIALAVRHLIVRTAPSGWPTLMVIVLFIGGVQLIAIGVIGEYVGRLFLHHSRAPQYIISSFSQNADNTL